MSGPFQVAALFVMPKGVYVGHDRIDAWTEERDAAFVRSAPYTWQYHGQQKDWYTHTRRALLSYLMRKCRRCGDVHSHVRRHLGIYSGSYMRCPFKCLHGFIGLRWRFVEGGCESFVVASRRSPLQN